MTKHRVSELDGALLDAAVAKADERRIVEIRDRRCHALTPMMRGGELHGHAVIPFQPSTRWSDGGPIIERERINLQARDGGIWQAHYNGGWAKMADTPLIAAMRAYVASKLGEEVELP